MAPRFPSQSWNDPTWGATTTPAAPAHHLPDVGDVVHVEATVRRTYTAHGVPWVAVEVDGNGDLVHVEASLIRQVTE